MLIFSFYPLERYEIAQIQLVFLFYETVVSWCTKLRLVHCVYTSTNCFMTIELSLKNAVCRFNKHKNQRPVNLNLIYELSLNSHKGLVQPCYCWPAKSKSFLIRHIFHSMPRIFKKLSAKIII